MRTQSRALNTPQASAYLEEIGLPFSPGTLEVWRCQGRGPRYRKVCNRVVYMPKDLDRFADGQVVETIDSRQVCLPEPNRNKGNQPGNRRQHKKGIERPERRTHEPGRTYRRCEGSGPVLSSCSKCAETYISSGRPGERNQRTGIFRARDAPGRHLWHNQLILFYSSILQGEMAIFQFKFQKKSHTLITVLMVLTILTILTILKNRVISKTWEPDREKACFLNFNTSIIQGATF